MSEVKISTLAEFDPPGYPYVNDGLNQQERQAWSAQVSSWMNTELTAKYPDGTPLTGGDDVLRTPLQQFFNGTITPYDVKQKPVAITWIGFPKLVGLHKHSN